MGFTMVGGKMIRQIRKILWYLGNLKHIYFMYQYKKHLKMRIEKNDFGRNEEW